jgi:hypothetical protein
MLKLPILNYSVFQIIHANVEENEQTSEKHAQFKTFFGNFENVFNYLENCKICGKSVLTIKCVPHLSVILFQAILNRMNM